jgi:hypothetical protein
MKIVKTTKTLDRPDRYQAVPTRNQKVVRAKPFSEYLEEAKTNLKSELKP